VSLSSIVLPCALGAALGWYLLRGHPSAEPRGFVLFMGVAMSITAFPVLARILADRDMLKIPLGGLALTCAAIDDVLAWSLLAVVVAAVSPADNQWRLLIALPYLLAMLYPVRLWLRRLVAHRQRAGRLTPGLLSVVLTGLLASGAVTEWIGLHFIFGAFLFGVVMPRTSTSPLRDELQERIGQVSNVLLLPVFFVVAGLKVNLSHLHLADLADLGLIMVAAIGGKGAGAYLAARANRLNHRTAAALATLMNTRGLTELVILNVGLQLGVLDTGLYSLMVVMAVVTTAMAGPILGLVYPSRLIAQDRDRSGDATPARPDGPAPASVTAAR
jgi:Kef-type K+ transport system membrane component KefB